jgi:hypothetical protein
VGFWCRGAVVFWCFSVLLFTASAHHTMHLHFAELSTRTVHPLFTVTSIAGLGHLKTSVSLRRKLPSIISRINWSPYSFKMVVLRPAAFRAPLRSQFTRFAASSSRSGTFSGTWRRAGQRRGYASAAEVTNKSSDLPW